MTAAKDRVYSGMTVLASRILYEGFDDAIVSPIAPESLVSAPPAP